MHYVHTIACIQEFAAHLRHNKVQNGVQHPPNYTLILGTNISLPKALSKMCFLFPRWDMLVPWKGRFHMISSDFPAMYQWVFFAHCWQGRFQALPEHHKLAETPNKHGRFLVRQPRFMLSQFSVLVATKKRIMLSIVKERFLRYLWYGCQNTPKWSFLVGKPMVVG